MTTRRLQGAAPALTAGALAAALTLLGGCGGYHPAAVPADEPVAQASDDWVEGCIDDRNVRVSDDYCDAPHAHYYPVWHPLGGGYLMPAYGVPLYGGGWSTRGQRPASVTNVNVVNHVSSSGGSVARNGTGTGITSSSRVSGRAVSQQPSRVAPRTGGPTGASTPRASSSTVSRGGLGVTGSTSTTSSSSSSGS